MKYEDVLDKLAHRDEDDCAYNNGRECDCSQPLWFAERLKEIDDWRLFKLTFSYSTPTFSASQPTSWFTQSYEDK